MQPKELEEIFARTLDDRRLSRGERRVLQELVTEEDLPVKERLRYYRRAFAVAHGQLADPRDRALLEWLEDVAKALFGAPRGARPQVAEACFAPGEACARRLVSLCDEAVHSLEICVFTITHDVLANAILRAYRRGVTVRILSDNKKAFDEGSDIFHLSEQGVPVRMDDSPDHMHHKFALFDRRVVVTGSYNWTLSASRHNRENIAVSDDQRLVAPYAAEFERLWETYGGPEPG